jgi:uncharacterized protein (TIGR02145 family)
MSSATRFVFCAIWLSLFLAGCTKDDQEPVICQPQPDQFTDARDGNTYRYITIGEQVWMAENLRYLPSINHPHDTSSVEPKFYVYDYFGTDLNEAKATENYRIYGVLYNWVNALGGASPTDDVPSGIRGICPEGWHLPSIPEFNQMIDTLGGHEVAGGTLKAVNDLWEEPNWMATDSVGFGALPSGLHELGSHGAFNMIGEHARFHSTSVGGFFDTPRGLTLWNLSGSALIAGGSIRQGRCVRCIKDTE